MDGVTTFGFSSKYKWYYKAGVATIGDYSLGKGLQLSLVNKDFMATTIDGVFHFGFGLFGNGIKNSLSKRVAEETSELAHLQNVVKHFDNIRKANDGMYSNMYSAYREFSNRIPNVKGALNLSLSYQKLFDLPNGYAASNSLSRTFWKWKLSGGASKQDSENNQVNDTKAEQEGVILDYRPGKRSFEIYD